MSEQANRVSIQNNEAAHRYETVVDGHLAQVQYKRTADTITFTHTVVPSELEGRGIGGLLAQTVLDDARSQQLKVVPQCPFIAGYIKRHAEYLPLVPPEERSRVENA